MRENRHTDASLVQFILKGLRACSMDKYLGTNLPEGRHTTLANSAINGKRLDAQLRRERLETEDIMRSIRATCKTDI